MLYNEFMKRKMLNLVSYGEMENYPCEFNSNGQFLKAYRVYGNSFQSEIPTPTTPCEIESVGTLITDTENEHFGKYKITLNNTYENTINIYLDEPLRKIDTYSDYIDYKSQKVVRNIGKIAFDGTEDIFKNEANNPDSTAYYIRISHDKNCNGMCNRLTASAYNVSINSINTINFARNTAVVYFNLNNNLLPENSISGVKSLLATWHTSNSPLTGFYVLSTPSYENVSLPKLYTQKGNNIITADTEIEPSSIYVKFQK